MEKKLILRGIIAGAIAGLLAFAFARIFAEPVIQASIDYESGRDAAIAALTHTAAESTQDVFGRTVQGNIGIGVGIVGFGAAMGALVAVAYAICLGRVGNLRPRSLAVLVAGFGFAGFYLVPFVKYPANPPSIGHPETIGTRSGLYLLMVGASLLFLVLAVVLGQKLRNRFGNWNATLLAAAAFVVVIGIVMAVLPQLGHLAVNVTNYGLQPTETPLPLTNAAGVIVYPGFPADTLYKFRFLSVANQLLLWTALGLLFAPMADRLLVPLTRPARPSADFADPAKA